MKRKKQTFVRAIFYFMLSFFSSQVVFGIETLYIIRPEVSGLESRYLQFRNPFDSVATVGDIKKQAYTFALCTYQNTRVYSAKHSPLVGYGKGKELKNDDKLSYDRYFLEFDALVNNANMPMIFCSMDEINRITGSKNFKVQDENRNTYMHYACCDAALMRSEPVPVIEYFKQNIPDAFEAKNNDGLTPRDIALLNFPNIGDSLKDKSKDILKAVFDTDQVLQIKDGKTERNVCHMLVDIYGKAKFLRAHVLPMLQKFAKNTKKFSKQVNEKDKNGDTSLHLAAQYKGTYKVIRLLMQHGADPVIKNNAGDIAIITALKKRSFINANFVMGTLQDLVTKAGNEEDKKLRATTLADVTKILEEYKKKLTSFDSDEAQSKSIEYIVKKIDILSNLPDELIFAIGKYLDPKDLAALRETSKRFSSFTREDIEEIVGTKRVTIIYIKPESTHNQQIVDKYALDIPFKDNFGKVAEQLEKKTGVKKEKQVFLIEELLQRKSFHTSQMINIKKYERVLNSDKVSDWGSYDQFYLKSIEMEKILPKDFSISEELDYIACHLDYEQLGKTTLNQAQLGKFLKLLFCVPTLGIEIREQARGKMLNHLKKKIQESKLTGKVLLETLSLYKEALDLEYDHMLIPNYYVEQHQLSFDPNQLIQALFKHKIIPVKETYQLLRILVNSIADRLNWLIQEDKRNGSAGGLTISGPISFLNDLQNTINLLCEAIKKSDLNYKFDQQQEGLSPLHTILGLLKYQESSTFRTSAYRGIVNSLFSGLLPYVDVNKKDNLGKVPLNYILDALENFPLQAPGHLDSWNKFKKEYVGFCLILAQKLIEHGAEQIIAKQYPNVRKLLSQDEYDRVFKKPEKGSQAQAKGEAKVHSVFLVKLAPSLRMLKEKLSDLHKKLSELQDSVN